VKQTRPKLHLLDAAEPLLGFHGLICRCQTELHTASPQFMVTEEWDGILPSSVSVCRKCQEMKPQGEEKRRYIYGLCEGQEERDAES